MKLPDWLYGRLERVYFDERDRRRKEAEARLDRDEREMRDYYDDLLARHRAGTCGGPGGKCCYVPCVPRVD